MNNRNSTIQIKFGKILKRFKLNPKNKQKIIKEAENDYSSWSSLERLARNLEFKNSIIGKR